MKKNKKIIFIVLGVIIIVIGIIVGALLWDNRTMTTITLDINPCVQLKLNKEEKVKSVKALNEDAKKIATSDIKGKKLPDAIRKIADNVEKSGYLEDDEIVILIYATGQVDNGFVRNEVEGAFHEKVGRVETILVENITKEDKELAKKYNISPAKAAYINSMPSNKNVKTENLANKSVEELEDMKRTGNYCEEGYTLEGDFCLKEIDRVPASNGEVCPKESYEYEGNCYEEVPANSTDKLECREDFQLDGKNCSRTVSMNADPVKFKCPYGEESTNYLSGRTSDPNADNANDIVCMDTSHAVHPISPCETHDGTEYTIAGGVCYWHRAPVIEAGCPGKTQVGDMCWDNASDVLICEGARDGRRYSSRNEYCEESITYIDPIVTEYNCPDDFTVEGDKCIKKEIEKAEYEKVCPDGYTKVDGGRCINMNKTFSKEDGYICTQENSRPKGKTCIIYEIVEANHSE